MLPLFIFSTSFDGIGLQSYTYSQFTPYFINASQSVGSCSSLPDGICSLPSDCEDYDFLNEFSFQVMFEGSENFLRIPLAGLAKSNDAGGCNILVSNLNTIDNVNNNILGGAFF